MDELAELKKRKLMELQAKQQDQIQERHALQQQVAQIEIMVKQFLTREAQERYGNLKVAHKEKATNVLLILSRMIQSGQIKSQIDDHTFREILKKLEPKKPDFKIKRI